MRISNDDFDRVQKCLQARRLGNDESGRPRVPTGAVICTGCGSLLVVSRTASGHRYYRCHTAMMSSIRDVGCIGVVRVPD